MRDGWLRDTESVTLKLSVFEIFAGLDPSPITVALIYGRLRRRYGSRDSYEEGNKSINSANQQSSLIVVFVLMKLISVICISMYILWYHYVVAVAL